jgi:hypothetical protein
MISGGYPLVTDEIKEDMRVPLTDIVSKRELRSLQNASLIRAQKI